jgi:DNA-binding LytR/AlgR family response regulator
MLKIAIVEDNEAAAEQLQGYLERYSAEAQEHFEMTHFKDAVGFLDRYRPVFDVVFMDIELPFMNGMEAARRLRESDDKIILVFVTNMAQFAARGYEVNAMDYIVKPVKYSDFQRKMERVVNKKKSTEEAVVITQQSGARRVLVSDIRYIEVRGHRLIYHTEEGEVQGGGTLLETEEKLRDKGFLRCNKCYLVNTKRIAAVQGYSLVMSGGDELQISRPRKRAFMNELAENMGNENVL